MSGDLDGLRDRMAEALGGFWDEADQSDALAALLPVVAVWADERAADELEDAADELPYAPTPKGKWLRDRADALRARQSRAASPGVHGQPTDSHRAAAGDLGRSEGIGGGQ